MWTFEPIETFLVIKLKIGHVNSKKNHSRFIFLLQNRITSNEVLKSKINWNFPYRKKYDFLIINIALLGHINPFII
jgi:hypothetical protein